MAARQADHHRHRRNRRQHHTQRAAAGSPRRSQGTKPMPARAPPHVRALPSDLSWRLCLPSPCFPCCHAFLSHRLLPSRDSLPAAVRSAVAAALLCERSASPRRSWRRACRCRSLMSPVLPPPEKAWAKRSQLAQPCSSVHRGPPHITAPNWARLKLSSNCSPAGAHFHTRLSTTVQQESVPAARRSVFTVKEAKQLRAARASKSAAIAEY